MGWVRLSAFLSVSLILASCSQFRNLSVSGDTLQGLEIAITKSDGRHAMRVCANRITIRDTDETVLWEIESRSDDCVWLRRLAYGETPPGFLALRPPAALQAGVTYDVSANGWTRAVPNIPWVAGGRVVFDHGRWKAIR